MFWPKSECLVYNSTSFPSLLIIFPIFFHNILNMAWITLSFNCRYLLMCVYTSHWPYGYQTFMLCSQQRMHGNPWCNLRHLCYHCERCWLPHGTKTTTCASFNTFNSFCWWINIVLTKGGIHTLANVVIVDPIRAYLLFWFCATQGFVTFNRTQAKQKTYRD